jgi:glycosyltransferase involved in cell wall biosynthesis
MAIRADSAEARVLPRTVAGATVLQIVPSLRDHGPMRATVDIARALVKAGARAIVAGERGPLVDELKSFGGEWLPFSSAALNPIKLRSNAAALDAFVTEQRVDIIHAKTAGAAWSALATAEHHAIGLVTELPDLPPARMRLASFYLGSLSRGDRVIAHSMFSAGPMIERHGIAIDRISIIPRGIDLAAFDPAAVQPERVARLRQSWGIPSRVRIVLAPGRVAPGHGQMTLVDTARLLIEGGVQGVTFVLAGDDQRHKRYARSIMAEAQSKGVAALFRMVGHSSDMAAAYGAADVVVVPYVAAPVLGRVVAEALAMARPVIATTVGPLAENMVTPPAVPDELRTGWLVPPGHPAELALAIRDALALDAAAYRAMAARARQFAESTFAPDRIANATLEVYASLLASKD